MIGVIRSWDILFHPVATIQCFGWRVFFNAVNPWYNRTFLSLLGEVDAFEATTSRVPDLLERCIRLELQAKQIYATLAQQFADTESARQFFAVLARHEQDHADLLQVCRAIAKFGGWKADYFSEYEILLQRLEQQIQEMESSLTGICSLDDALRQVILIELSEINHVFFGIVTFTDVSLIKKLKPFYDAMDIHIAYICFLIPELAPNLTVLCRELRARSPRGK